MALERVPSDIRKEGGVARMAPVEKIEEIQRAVTIPVMAKARIGHFVEARVLEQLGVDFIDESEVLTPADGAHHIEKRAFKVPFVCGATDLGEVAAHLAGLSPDEVTAIVEESWHDHAECDDSCDLPAVELGPPDEVQARLVGTLSAVHERVGDELAAFEPKQRHTLELIRFLKRRMPVEQLIETVTNGVAYHAEAGVSEIVLVPSALIRPWNLVFLFGSSRYFVHPISDDSVDADADTPPSWMLDLFKALGDERRLRILRRLREVDGATLGELVEYLDLAKSTTHHHLRTLRAAGLVRTRLVTGKSKEDTRYELRADLLPDVMGLVGEYLLGPADQTTD